MAAGGSYLTNRPGRVVLEVAESSVQFVFLHAGEGIDAGGVAASAS